MHAMQIIQAAAPHLDTVQQIVQETIRTVYPHYYPPGAVAFFLRHHSTENIRNDLLAGNIRLCCTDAGFTGTVTVKENEICRLFVLPQYQGMGFGRALIQYAETYIAARYPEIRLDASFPAKAIYLKRGYQSVSYHTLATDNGDYLCYDEMTKTLPVRLEQADRAAIRLPGGKF